MISTFLVAHPWLSPAALALLVAAGPFAGRWLAGRRPVAVVLLMVALVAVIVLTLMPAGREIDQGCELAWALPTPGRVEVVANVVLFVAPVLLAGVVLRRPLLALVAGSALSASIEVIQALATGLGRSCSANDWLANTIGALIGAALAWVALRPARADRTARP